MKTTTAITTVKRDVKLQEWMERIRPIIPRPGNSNQLHGAD